jgi:phosphoglucomutase
VTGWIQERANAPLADGLKGVQRIPFERARRAATTRVHDYLGSYVGDLASVVDFEPLRGARIAQGVDPLGGAGVHYWGAIGERYQLALTVVSSEVDPTFRFMTVDWDGRIRMDCSSPYAMQRLIGLQSRFDVAWACGTDHDRHGVVTRSAGLLNPNHYLAVAISYLFQRRKGWPAAAGIGKTIDRLARKLGRPLLEVPVGFKWFADGLRDGSVWTTDKDGIVLGLLAAEMTAVTSRDPGELYRILADELGEPAYERIDAPATPEQKAILKRLLPEQVKASTLGGEPITAVSTRAPGNDAPLGGLKVATESNWFAVRPSGTEDVYKLYAESFRGADHLHRIQTEAQALVEATFADLD